MAGQRNGARQRGTVRFFDAEQGFGAITPVMGGKDVVVRASGLEASGLRDINPGQQVSYETMTEDKRNVATAVHIQLA
jgi:CspA family cold shock protein